jgi:hypothetical protein
MSNVSAGANRKYGYKNRYYRLQEIPSPSKHWVTDIKSSEQIQGEQKRNEQGQPIVTLDQWSLQNLRSDSYIEKVEHDERGQTMWKTKPSFWAYLQQKQQEDEAFELVNSFN